MENENSSYLQKTLYFIYALIPSFARFGLILKISLTIFLCGICADLFYAKINPALPLIKGALTFSPEKYANKLVAEDKLKTAEAYIDFYSSIPGARTSPQLEDLRNKIHAKRTGIISGALHQGKHAWKGITGEESDELVAGAANVAVDISGASDARDLYMEWKNYSSGKEVDKLSAGLAAVGLTMTLGKFAGGIGAVVTGGTSAAGAYAMFEPVRKMCLTIRKSLKFMNPKLKRACQKLFEPVFQKITKMKLLDNLPMPSIPSGSLKDKASSVKKFAESDQLKTYLHKHIDDIKDVAKLMQSKIDSLGDVITLARKDPYAAKLIAENAGDLKKLSSLSKTALSLGEEGRSIFRFGGKNALNAMETLNKQGKLSGTALKQSMRVGESGLQALAKGCWRNLDKMIYFASKYKALLWWFMVQWFLSKIPLAIVLLLELLIISILLKSWGSTLVKAFRQSA